MSGQAAGRASLLFPAVVWLRRYPICRMLGYLFGVDGTTALRTNTQGLPVLEAARLGSFRLPGAGPGQRPTIITSNKGLTAWGEIAQDVSLATALADRL